MDPVLARRPARRPPGGGTAGGPYAVHDPGADPLRCRHGRAHLGGERLRPQPDPPGHPIRGDDGGRGDDSGGRDHGYQREDQDRESGRARAPARLQPAPPLPRKRRRRRHPDDARCEGSIGLPRSPRRTSRVPAPAQPTARVGPGGPTRAERPPGGPEPDQAGWSLDCRCRRTMTWGLRRRSRIADRTRFSASAMSRCWHPGASGSSGRRCT